MVWNARCFIRGGKLMLLRANVYLSINNILIVHINDVSKPAFPGHYFPLEFQLLPELSEQIEKAYLAQFEGGVTKVVEPPEVHLG